MKWGPLRRMRQLTTGPQQMKRTERERDNWLTFTCFMLQSKLSLTTLVGEFVIGLWEKTGSVPGARFHERRITNLDRKVGRSSWGHYTTCHILQTHRRMALSDINANEGVCDAEWGHFWGTQMTGLQRRKYGKSGTPKTGHHHTINTILATSVDIVISAIGVCWPRQQMM